MLENLYLSAIGIAAAILVISLASLVFGRRRQRRTRTPVFNSAEFRTAHVQPTAKPAPTVAKIRRSLEL